MARLPPPESAPLQAVSREIGVSVDTLERWRSESLSRPVKERVWTAAARLEAVITTAAMDDASRSAWCRENGVYAQQLQQWRDSATQALAAPEEARASPSQTKEDRRRIKELEREVRRKDKALAETAALLVLSKKAEAIFNRNKGEDELSASKIARKLPETSKQPATPVRGWNRPARSWASPRAPCNDGRPAKAWNRAMAGHEPCGRYPRMR